MKNTKIKYILLFFAAFILYKPILHAQGWQKIFSDSGYTILAVCSDLNNSVYTSKVHFDTTVFRGRYYNVTKWNGSSWSELGTNTLGLHANNKIMTLCTDDSANVYAAGSFSPNGPHYYLFGHCYVAKWNIRLGTWSALGNDSSSFNNEINTVCVDKNHNVYAAGLFTNANGYFYVAKWNGVKWNELGFPGHLLYANHEIESICADDSGNIYAAGNFTDANGYAYVAKWNGSTWGKLGSSFDSVNTGVYINSLCMDKAGNLYAGVTLEKLGSSSYFHSNVYKWDGVSWIQLGSGVNALNANQPIYSICVDSLGFTYAGGAFTDSLGNEFVAKWNPTTEKWSELGNNYVKTAYVTSFCLDNNCKIYVAATPIDSFTGIYRFDTPQVKEYIHNACDAIKIYPNPNKGIFTFSATLTDTTKEVLIEIINITGQLVHTLHKSNNSIGTLNVTNLAKGLYIYKAVTNNKTQTGKIVIE